MGPAGPGLPPGRRHRRLDRPDHPRGRRRAPRPARRPAGATVVLAGDLTGTDALEVLTATLGAWDAPRHEPGSRPVAPRPAADRARVVVVDRPGSVQTEIAVSCPGPDRSTPHGWAPHPVLAFVVGGSPNARLDAVLREEKGYTYGIRSSFRPRVAGGSFVTSGSVRSEVTGEALELLLGILGDARDGSPRPSCAPGSTSSARPPPAGTPPPTRSRTRPPPSRWRGCRWTSRRATSLPCASSASRTSTPPTGGWRRGSGPSSSSATPRASCPRSRAGCPGR